MWAAREVERMEVSLNWLLQVKLYTVMSITSWADAESGVKGLSRSAGAPPETWLQAEDGTPLERWQEGVITARCQGGKGTHLLPFQGLDML